MGEQKTAVGDTCAGCGLSKKIDVIYGSQSKPETMRGFCHGCGEKKIPVAAPCSICDKPCSVRSYLTVQFPDVGSAVIPLCSSACRTKCLGTLPGANVRCKICKANAVVRCSMCDVAAYCSDECMKQDAEEHKKECAAEVSDDARPCELAFAFKDKYAVFKNRWVVVDAIAAKGCIARARPLPPGIEWKIIHAREPSCEVAFDLLIEMAKGVTEHGKKFDLHVAHPKGPIPLEYFGTREIAEAWAKQFFSQYKWEVRPVTLA